MADLLGKKKEARRLRRLAAVHRATYQYELDGDGEKLAELLEDATARERRGFMTSSKAPKMTELFERARGVLLPHDYLNYRLTGEPTMEAGDASGTGLLDPVSRSFRMDDARVIDERLPDMLPGILPAGAQAGVLSSEGGALLGLPEGVLVSAGGGDNMMSAVGSGATRPGVVVVSLGTSGTVFTHAEAPVVDPEGLIAPFCASVGGFPAVARMSIH